MEEIVVTGTRTPRLRSDATVATEVLTRDEIAERGAVNVQEALRDQVGLESNPSFYGAHAARVQMMGLDGSRVLVMVDGLRLVGESGGAVDLRRLPVDLVERIEIVKGPMSSLYGTDALGGVINIVTRRDERPGFHGGGLVEARSLPGSPGGAQRVSADGAWAGGRGGLQAGVAYHRAASYDLLPGDQTLSGPERQELTGSLSGDLRFGEGMRLEGGVELHRSSAVSRLEQTYPGLPSALVDLPDRFSRLRTHAGLEIQKASLGRLHFRIANTHFGGTADKDRRQSPLDEHRRRWHDLGIVELTLTRSLGERQTLTAGVQATGEWFRQALTRMETDGSAVRAVEVVEVPRRQLLSEEVFAQDEIHAGPLVLAPGVRYVHHHTFGHEIAPKLAAVLNLHPRLRLRGQIGRGFRAPSAQELAFNFDHSFYGYKVIGNPDLRPETSLGLQSGAELGLPFGVALQGTLYYNWLSNLIVTELDPAQSRPELRVSTYENIGRAHSAGGEAAIAWRPSARFMLQGGYAYVRAVDDVSGLSVPGRPPHTVQGAMSVTVPASETRVDLRGRYTDATLARRDDAGMELVSPGWGTIDVRIAQPIERVLGHVAAVERLEIYAGVENLLDRRRDPTNPADIGPEPGRVIYAGIRGRR